MMRRNLTTTNKKIESYRAVRCASLAIVAATGILVLSGCTNEAEKNYEKACELGKEENYQEACDYFEQAINEDPDIAAYYIDYGFTLIKMGNYSEAVTQFNKAILSSDEDIVEPNNKITRTNNKKAYRGKAIAYYESHDYKNAVKFFEYALEINEVNELNEDIRKYLADSLKESGEYERAIEEYEKILDESDKDDQYKLHEEIAQCYVAVGNYEDALKYYDEAIKDNPNTYSTYLGKYNIYKAQNDEENANKAIEDALSIKDNSDESILYKGELYYMTGEIEKALGCLKKAGEIELDEAFYYLAKIYIETEDYDKAIDSLNQYIDSEKGKKSAVAYEELIGLLIDKEDYEEASVINDMALALNNSNYSQSFRYYQVAILEGQGDFEGALTYAKAYCKDYPDDKEMKREVTFLDTRVNRQPDEESEESESN